jgi:hypothetical protein
MTSKAVLTVIKSFGNAACDNCRPCAATIGGCLGITRRTVFRAIKELQARRIITVVPQFEGGKQIASIYLINDEQFAKHIAKPFKLKEGCQKRHTKGVSKETHEQDSVTRASEPAPNVIPMPKTASGG